MNEAVATIRGSKRHLVATAVLCAAIFGWYSVRHAPLVAFIVVGALGLLLVGINIVRIARARRALREPARMATFAEERTRSERRRGRFQLVASPIVVLVTWVGAIASPSPLTIDAWIVVGGITLFLANGWLRWLRVVRAT